MVAQAKTQARELAHAQSQASCVRFRLEARPSASITASKGLRGHIPKVAKQPPINDPAGHG
eukprot:10939882-Alexandrium_andersonii.AAC.1